MARQDKDGFVDPAVVAAWRRMLWLVRGSADVVEALVPVAAGMTKEEVSRLLARAGAPSGKGVEPVEQVLGLLGVVPRARYEALLDDYQTLLKEYEELGTRVGEAEQNIERLRGILSEQGLADEEQLLDSWGGLVRRTLRAQAGLMRSIASAAGNVAPPAPPIAPTSRAEPSQAETSPVEPIEAGAPEAVVPKPAPPKPAPPKPAAPRRTAGAGRTTTKRASPRGGTADTASRAATSKRAPESEPAAADSAPSRPAGASKGTPKRTSSRARTAATPATAAASKRAKRTG